MVKTANILLTKLFQQTVSSPLFRFDPGQWSTRVVRTGHAFVSAAN